MEVQSPSETSLPGTTVSLPAVVAGGDSRSVSSQESAPTRPSRGKRSDSLSLFRYLIDLFRGNARTLRSQSQPQDSTDPESALGNPIHVSGQNNTLSATQRSQSRSSGDANHPEQTLANESRGSSDIDGESGVRNYTLKSSERSIFYGALPRGPLLDYSAMISINNLAYLKQHLDTGTSTAVNLAAWIRAYAFRQGNTPAHYGPLDFLFAIIQRDTLSTLQLMDQALTQIGRDIVDDNLIQQNLTKWRFLLERFDAELRSLEKSLSKTATFIAPLISSSRDDDQMGPTSSPLVADLLRKGEIEIVNMRQRATSSYQSLMASMSIVESKRGIAEAEGVAKLTELAFFFIPLTFSASIFSMQVKELNAADVSVSAFIALAVIITFLSYALRLLIRSESFIGRRREWVQSIRSYADLSPEASIPTTAFLLWVRYRLGWKLKIAAALAVAIGPLVALWTQHLASGIKIGATAAIGIVFVSYPMFLLLKAMQNGRNQSMTRSGWVRNWNTESRAA